MVGGVGRYVRIDRRRRWRCVGWRGSGVGCGLDAAVWIQGVWRVGATAVGTQACVADLLDRAGVHRVRHRAGVTSTDRNCDRRRRTQQRHGQRGRDTKSRGCPRVRRPIDTRASHDPVLHDDRRRASVRDPCTARGFVAWQRRVLTGGTASAAGTTPQSRRRSTTSSDGIGVGVVTPGSSAACVVTASSSGTTAARDAAVHPVVTAGMPSR